MVAICLRPGESLAKFDLTFMSFRRLQRLCRFLFLFASWQMGIASGRFMLARQAHNKLGSIIPNGPLLAISIDGFRMSKVAPLKGLSTAKEAYGWSTAKTCLEEKIRRSVGLNRSWCLSQSDRVSTLKRSETSHIVEMACSDDGLEMQKKMQG